MNSKADMVVEKIDKLRRLIPQNDAIWEKLSEYINHLFFVKVSESVVQQSPINNTNNACPGKSTANNINTLGNLDVSQSSRENIITSTPRPLYYYECYVHERLVIQEAKNSLTRQSASQTENESTEESDSTVRSDDSSALNVSEEVVIISPKKDDTSVQESIQRASSLSANSNKVVKPTKSHPKKVIGDSLLYVQIPRLSFVSSMSSARKPQQSRYYFRNKGARPSFVSSMSSARKPQQQSRYYFRNKGGIS